MRYFIGWVESFNAMDGSAELVGFMRTLKIVDSQGLQFEISEFKRRHREDGAKEEDFEAGDQSDGWYSLNCSDYAWIAYKEVQQ